MEASSALGKTDEEFCNFMHRVTEVESIIKKLASSDRELQNIGNEEAKKYLAEQPILENIDEEKVALKITTNRTIVNQKALQSDGKSPNEMSQEAFMEEVSQDADKRYKDRLVRQEKMETFKKQAALSFRRGDYERALVLYNKAIEQVKDSVLLYNNRALTKIKLGLFEQAKSDLKNWALRLNEDCLKSWLLLAKTNFLSGNSGEYEECISQAKKRNPGDIQFIKGAILARVHCARHFQNQATESAEENSHLFDLLKKYEYRLLYSSILEQHRIRYGYHQQRAFIKKTEMADFKLKTAIRSLRPLPVSLKYFTDYNLDDIEKSAAEEAESEIVEEADSLTNFPYKVNATVEDEGFVDEPKKPDPHSIKKEIEARKEALDNDKENWMTHYENYEDDLEEHNERLLFGDGDDWKVNYGTPDPRCAISNVPCGGCGAYLHCQDSSIPGYIPSEIFKNSFKRHAGAPLSSLLCQRCHFLKEYNIALQVRVSPDDYPKILQNIAFNSGLALLMVDLTDFPCSIWPGIADILGPKASIVVVGNKVDLLPKDDYDHLKKIKEAMFNSVKLHGFGTANIKSIELISAKTGFGVERLIDSLLRVWKWRGDVYIIGCTNVGKSSLFNLLLQSDFCKIQAADLIQRSTTSPWPGTTLNLLKFPITRFGGHRMFARRKRLEMLQKIEKQELKLNREMLSKENVPSYATLIGRVERSQQPRPSKDEIPDNFSVGGTRNVSGITCMGINEELPEFVHGKWCYDTPGVMHPDQILHLLTTEELVRTLPKELIRPETFCVKPGSSLFIAGLARLDYVNGRNSVRLTVFRANTLPITICKTTEADRLYEELLGTELLAVPILKSDRKEKWPGLELAKSFKVFGKCEDLSSYDVVLSSAGWVAINCNFDNYEFSAWTPEKRGVHLRDALLPKAVTMRGRRVRDSVAYGQHKLII
ncbi:hypothetical protein D910_05027 [Dendroctonus ponderosae]|uniref:Uncharacterized protein n=1 Tax=Dendroctonus ponderosae TaxID=77166 RepID=U4UAJ8_DENPD|nr:hypothetical protein D910_05027 [Dendroctonus ponderosae]KAH1012572.1 hypothetical protein HUJ05_011710 [Dendroctonus ponderosae]